MRTLHILYKNKGYPNLDVFHQNLNMTMNMCIIMYMNIYISPQNEEKLRQIKRSGESMSGVINELLHAYFTEGKGRVVMSSPVETPYSKLGGTAPKSDVSDLLKTPTFEETKTAVHDWDVAPKDVTVLTSKSKFKPMPTADTNIERGYNEPGGELSCCKNETQPCKHWIWDAQTGEGYKNILSGRFLEVE